MTPIDSKNEKIYEKSEKYTKNIRKYTKIYEKYTKNGKKGVCGQTFKNHPKIECSETQFSKINLQKNQCQFCKKIYSKNSNLHRHLKKCKMNISKTDKLLNYIKLIENEKEEIQKKNEIISKEKAILKKKVERLIENSNNNTTVNMQQNIYINNYGNENLGYLTKGYFDNLLKIPFVSIQKLIKEIHFNPRHPENNNIKIPNKKQKYAIVYKNGKWEFRHKKEVIEDMVDNSYNIMDCHFEDNKMILNDKKRNNFLQFQIEYDKNQKFKKDIKKDVELELLNYCNNEQFKNCVKKI